MFVDTIKLRVNTSKYDVCEFLSLLSLYGLETCKYCVGLTVYAGPRGDQQALTRVVVFRSSLDLSELAKAAKKKLQSVSV